MAGFHISWPHGWKVSHALVEQLDPHSYLCLGPRCSRSQDEAAKRQAAEQKARAAVLQQVGQRAVQAVWRALVPQPHRVGAAPAVTTASPLVTGVAPPPPPTPHKHARAHARTHTHTYTNTHTHIHKHTHTHTAPPPHAPRRAVVALRL